MKHSPIMLIALIILTSTMYTLEGMEGRILKRTPFMRTYSTHESIDCPLKIAIMIEDLEAVQKLLSSLPAH